MAYIDGKEIMFSANVTPINVTVEQTTGNSTEHVMSQKAVTDAVARNSKRIANLEQRLSPELFVTDNSSAHIKTVPTNALPFAEITRFGGMSYKVGDALIHAKLTAFKSNGANLWSEGDIVATGYNQEIKNVFENLTPNKPYALSWDYTSNGTESAQDVIIVYTDAGGFNIANGTSFTITQEQINTFNIAYAYFGSDATSGRMTNIMLNEGEIALPYMPFREPITLAMPAAVQALDGYGYGINKNCYNYVEWGEGKKKYHKVIKKDIVSNVFKPSSAYDNIQYFGFEKPTDFVGHNSTSNAFIIDGFATRENAGDWDNSAHIGSATGEASWDSIWVGFPIGTTLAEAKAALEGKEWIYALKTPEVTDISAILPDDNFIAVEGGGTITAVNDNDFDIPSEIIYQMEIE